MIADGLSLAAKGMSMSGVATELGRKGHHFPSTTYRWAARFGPLMDAHAKKFSPWTGFKWHCDETFHKILGKEAYLFMVMDHSARFVLASMTPPKKFGAKPLRMFREAAHLAGVVPRVFVTDGLGDFAKPARKAFWRSAGRRFVHIAEIHAQNEFNHNNVQESLNGDLKPLLRRRGGFKMMDSPLVGLAILGYNFRPHGALGGRTPAEAAGIRPEGDDRILTLLEAAAA